MQGKLNHQGQNIAIVRLVLQQKQFYKKRMIVVNNRTLLADYNKILRRSVYLSGGINIYSVVIIAVLVTSSQFTLYHKFSDKKLNGTITLHDYNFIPSMLLYTMGFYAMLLKTLAVQVCQLLPSANFLHKLLWRQMLLIQP